MSRSSLFCLAILVLTLLAGCATSPPAQFYTLAPVHLVELQPDIKPVAIAIGPVTVPELVDRPQIVSRIDENRVSIDEFARWADPLKSQIPRVLAADLMQLLPGSIVSIYPQHVDDNGFRVSVDVQSFDSPTSGTVVLAAIWSVRAPGRGEPVEGRTVVRENVTGPGYGALVSAHSQALASVSRDIALAMLSTVRY